MVLKHCFKLVHDFPLSGDGVHTELTLLTLNISSSLFSGLKERDLYSVLNTCNDLSSRDRQATWQEVLQLSRKPKGRIPMATFTRIVQNLQRYESAVM